MEKNKKKSTDFKYKPASNTTKQIKAKKDSHLKVSEALVAQNSYSSLSVKTDPALYNNARTARVTITIDSSLLATIDDYVEQHQDTNRSAEFERALNMWVLWLQEKCDRDCYQKMSAAQKKEHDAWTAVTTEAAKYIWP